MCMYVCVCVCVCVHAQVHYRKGEGVVESKGNFFKMIEFAWVQV